MKATPEIIEAAAKAIRDNMISQNPMLEPSEPIETIGVQDNYDARFYDCEELAVAALSAAPAAMPVEPVIAYVRTKDLEWLKTHKGIQTHLYSEGGNNLTPLYATPPAPAVADGWDIVEMVQECPLFSSAAEFVGLADHAAFEAGQDNAVQNIVKMLRRELATSPAPATPGDGWPSEAKFQYGTPARKKAGSWWEGRVVGWYRTDQTALGYAVQLDREWGAVQIYPEVALEVME